MATPLVDDAVNSALVDDSIPAQRSANITVQQRPAPIATLALLVPLQPRAHLEVSGSFGRSTVRGEDDFGSWDVATAHVANLMLGVAYAYRNWLALHGGVGLTKLSTPRRGLFTDGNSAKPVLEIGASTSARLAALPLQLGARLQTHNFSTATLRENGGSGGNVVRMIVQVGTTVWQRRQ